MADHQPMAGGSSGPSQPLTSKQRASSQLKSNTLLAAVHRTAAGLPSLAPSAKKAGKVDKKNWVMSQFVKATAEQLQPGQNPDSGWCKHCVDCNDPNNPPDPKSLRALDNITRLGQHLLNYKVCNFHASEEARELAMSVSEVRDMMTALTKGPVRAPSDGGSMPVSTLSTSSRPPPAKRQAASVCDILSSEEQQHLTEKFAEMMYVTNMPFHWVEHPVVIDFFKRLRPAFQLPSRYDLSQPLLLLVYNKICAAVFSLLSMASFLVVTMDGWSRKQGDTHVINFQVCSYGFSYFQDMKVCTSATAKNLTNYCTELMDKHKLTNF